MNANRLNALLHLIQKDFQHTQLPQRITELSAALQAYIQSQNNNQRATQQQNLSNSLKVALEAAEKTTLDDLSPAWREMIEEIGYSNSLGGAVVKRLNEAFKQSDITPQIVKEEVDLLNQELTNLGNAVTQITASFKLLSIGKEDLEHGSSELGFLIPRESIDYRLDAFAKECKEFDFIFGTFSEIVTGDRSHYKINTISSSDLSVFLDSLPAVSALVATAAERVVAFYKQILEVKKLRSEMLKQGITEEALSAIDESQNTKMAKEIENLTTQIIEKYKNNHEPGRVNELKNSLVMSLHKLANRIDRGMHIEVRIAEIADNGEDDAEIDQDLENATNDIQRVTKSLQFIRPDGDPILSLPEEVTTPKKRAPAKKDTKKDNKAQ